MYRVDLSHLNQLGTYYIVSVKWTRIAYLGRDRLKLAIVVFGMVLTFHPFMEWDVGCLCSWSLMGTISLNCSILVVSTLADFGNPYNYGLRTELSDYEKVLSTCSVALLLLLSVCVVICACCCVGFASVGCHFVYML